MAEGEPSDKATTIGSAAVGGLLGVGLTGDLVNAAVLSALAAYASTLDNDFGSAAKKVGGLAAKAYGKALELNAEYNILQKAKGATDTVVNVADNLNTNYGFTDKLDEKLKLSDKIGKVTDQIDSFTSTVSEKADELKEASSSSKGSRSGNAKMMAEDSEPSDRAATIGAAALSAALGVWLSGDLATAAALASLSAYATTLDNDIGDAAKSAGRLAARAYDKTRDFNEKYDILPRAKELTDKVVNVGDNLNKNYGITEKIDEKLKISPAFEKATGKFEEVTSKVTSTVDELKSAAKDQ